MCRERQGEPLPLDILVPVLMSCALLWWVSRGMSWTTRLTVTAVTLAVIIGILLVERSGF
jgi:ABC-type amino acid transport system permease subunit